MNSIRTKITMLTVCAIMTAVTITTLLSVAAIKKIGDSNSQQMLLLLCETGEKNLNAYFKSVEQSVEMVSSYVEADLKNPGDLKDHVKRVNEIFLRTAYQTRGVLTCYYRIDPAVSDTVKGFWYINRGDEGFQPHVVTDITLYDTEDTSKLVWFTVPKATGRSIWLPPYVTDNLDVRVISYNVPIYRSGQFIGVVGIEIDYATMAEQVDNLKLYENGYAFITDGEGRIVYHPLMDVADLPDSEKPLLPYEPAVDGTPVRFHYDGVEKLAVWLPLDNGMCVNVTVPVSEINGSWQRLIYEVSAVAVILLAVFLFLTTRFADHVTKPLRDLTEAANQVNDGCYEFHLDYSGNDEVGILTHTFSRLIRHLKVYINDLNNMAYADALTSVRNKGAFDIYIRDLEARRRDSEENIPFAVGVFDCDDLKKINDCFGHEKGDIYLKSSSALICRVFQHCPVFRTGGDEFTVVLRNEDFMNRTELTRLFQEMSSEICSLTDVPWEKVNVSMGIATFDPQKDCTVEDVVRRADRLMYSNKNRRKRDQQAGMTSQ